MGPAQYGVWLLAREARALLTRVDRVRPLVLKETMVPAAALAADAQSAVEAFLFAGRRRLRQQLLDFLRSIEDPGARHLSPAEAQRGFMQLKLRFNAILTHFDMFSEAVSQRSEAETGVWLAGLDVVARDALALPGKLEPPPLVCFLARDPGGAIRRARTRLPGGGENPVALIRLPRERMLSGSVASSLVHEVGHQAVELLDLHASVQTRLLAASEASGTADGRAWRSWVGWLSEILADAWAIGAVGVGSTLGLISLVSLPSAFVFRSNPSGPHPTPWLRVLLSCAVGDALYPHPEWRLLAKSWTAFYPLEALPQRRRAELEHARALIPRFVDALLEHRAPRLEGAMLGDVLRRPARAPAMLQRLFSSDGDAARGLRRVPPTVALAAIGQARADGRVEPEDEADLLGRLLEHWALEATLRRARRQVRCDGMPPRAAAESAAD